MDSYVSRFQTVYLLDDHDVVRRGLRDLLVPARDIDVVGESDSAQRAVTEILRLDTDVMLLDLQLQDGTGVEVCRAVRSVRPSVTGLLLTAAEDDQALAAAVLAGAAGYLVKQARGIDLVGTIRKLRPGTSLLDAGSIERASRLLDSVVDSLRPGVTDVERRVLGQVIEGRTDRQISDFHATDDPDGGVDVVELVARVTRGLLAPEMNPGEAGAGRHRRTD